MATFAYWPPTQQQAMDDLFWGRFSARVGVSVVRQDGVFTLVPVPTHEELVAAGVEGTDWFRGGYDYLISEAVRDELVEAGLYPGATDDGYGLEPYGLTEFGE